MWNFLRAKNLYNNSCQISFLSEYTENDVGWGFVPDPIWELTAFPRDPLAGSRGRFAAGRKWSGKEGMD